MALILSDGDIEAALEDGSIGIEPRPARTQPASVDLTLGRHFVEWRMPGWGDVVDVRKPVDDALLRKWEVPEGEDAAIAIPSRGFFLGTTREFVRIGPGLVGRIEGRSSLGRLGIIVHVTAGYVDPGFEGELTLEIYNVNPNTVVLQAGMRIAQLSFIRLATPAKRPYAGKYQGQRGPTASRIDRDFGG